MLKTNDELLKYVERLYHESPDIDIYLCHYERGEMLCEQAHPVRYIHVVRDGLFKAFHTEENAKEYILLIQGCGQIIGDEEALNGHSNYLNSVISLSDASIYRMSVTHFLKLCDTDIRFCRLMLGEASRRMADAFTRASAQLLYPMKHVLAQLLSEMEWQNLELTKAEIAAYLGVELRTVNRLLKDL